MQFHAILYNVTNLFGTFGGEWGMSDLNIGI